MKTFAPDAGGVKIESFKQGLLNVAFLSDNPVGLFEVFSTSEYLEIKDLTTQLQKGKAAKFKHQRRSSIAQMVAIGEQEEQDDDSDSDGSDLGGADVESTLGAESTLGEEISPRASKVNADGRTSPEKKRKGMGRKSLGKKIGRLGARARAASFDSGKGAVEKCDAGTMTNW